MARGRMIAANLGESRKFAALQTDAARVIYTLIVANTDSGGRLEADSLYVTRKVCTRLPYDQAQVEDALNDMASTGLIILYEVADIPYLQVVKFREHNTPHHKEPDSDIPPPKGFNNEGEIIGNTVPDSTPQASAKHESSMTQASAKQADKRSKEKGSKEEGEGEHAPTSEERMARAFDTASPQANELHRVRSELNHLAGRAFTQKYAGDLAAWTRWTNDQLRNLWEASDPDNWPGEEHKRRAWILSDLLNEERKPPRSHEPDNFKSFEDIMAEIRAEA